MTQEKATIGILKAIAVRSLGTRGGSEMFGTIRIVGVPGMISSSSPLFGVWRSTSGVRSGISLMFLSALSLVYWSGESDVYAI